MFYRQNKTAKQVSLVSEFLYSKFKFYNEKI